MMICYKLRGVIFLVIICVISVILFEWLFEDAFVSKFNSVADATEITQHQPISRQLIVAEVSRSEPHLSGIVSQSTALNVNETIGPVNNLPEVDKVEVIQNLAAYPNQDSETFLTQELIVEQDARVRNAAARSLGIINSPSYVTIQALLDALEDESEAVCLTALSTLQIYLIQEEAYLENSSITNTNIRFALETKVLSDSVSKSIKQAITEVIEAG